MYYVIFVIVAILGVFFFFRKKKDNSIELNFKDDKIKVKYYGKGSLFDSGTEKIKDSYLFVADEDNYKAGLKLTFIVFKTNASSSNKISSKKNLNDFLTMTIAEKREYFSWVSNIEQKPANDSFIKIYLDGLIYAVIKFNDNEHEILKICQLFHIVENKHKKIIIELFRVCIRKGIIDFEKIVLLLSLERNSREYWILKDDKVSSLVLEMMAYNIDIALTDMFYLFFLKKLKKIEGIEISAKYEHFEEALFYKEREYTSSQAKKIGKFITSFKHEIKIFISKYKNKDLIGAYNYLTPEMKREIAHPQEEEFKSVFSVSKIYNIGDFFFLLGNRYLKEDSLSIRESKILASKLNDMGYCIIPDPHVSRKIYKRKHKVSIFKSKTFFKKPEYNDYFRLLGWSMAVTGLEKEELIIYLGEIVSNDNRIFLEKSIDLLLKYNKFSSKEIGLIQFSDKDKPLVRDFIKRIKNNIPKDKWAKILKYIEYNI